MKLKRVIAGLCAISFINVMNILPIKVNADVMANGTEAHLSSNPTSGGGSISNSVGDNWGTALNDISGLNNPNVGSIPGGTDGSSGGGSSTYKNGNVLGCAITTLYFNGKSASELLGLDKNVSAEVLSSELRKSMQDPSFRNKLSVWHGTVNSYDNNLTQKVIYSLSPSIPDSYFIMNDYYPVGVGDTGKSFDTTPWITKASEDKAFFNTKFKRVGSVSSDYICNHLTALWSNVWNITSSDAYFLGQNSNGDALQNALISGLGGSESAMQETLNNFKNNYLVKNNANTMWKTNDNGFICLYVEPLIAVDIKIGSGWVNGVLCTPTMLAEHYKFASSSTGMSNIGLNKFIPKVIRSTGTSGAAGTYGDSIPDESVDLRNMIENYGMGAYALFCQFTDGTNQKDDPLTAPVIHVYKAPDVKREESYASLSSINTGLTPQGAVSMPKDVWEQVESTYNYALHLTETEPNNALYSNSMVNYCVNYLRMISNTAYSLNNGNREYNDQYVTAYSDFMNSMIGALNSMGSISLTDSTLDGISTSYSFAEINNFTPSNYYGRLQDSTMIHGTSSTSGGSPYSTTKTITADEAGLYCENLTLSDNMTPSGSSTNGAVANNSIGYGDLLRYPYSYSIRYRNSSQPEPESTYARPTRPNVVITDEDTGDLWNSTIPDSVWNDMTALSNYMYCDGESNPDPNKSAPNGTVDSTDATSARKAMATMIKYQGYIENINKALEIIGTDSDRLNSAEIWSGMWGIENGAGKSLFANMISMDNITKCLRGVSHYWGDGGICGLTFATNDCNPADYNAWDYVVRVAYTHNGNDTVSTNTVSSVSLNYTLRQQSENIISKVRDIYNCVNGIPDLGVDASYLSRVPGFNYGDGSSYWTKYEDAVSEKIWYKYFNNGFSDIPDDANFDANSIVDWFLVQDAGSGKDTIESICFSRWRDLCPEEWGRLHYSREVAIDVYTDVDSICTSNGSYTGLWELMNNSRELRTELERIKEEYEKACKDFSTYYNNAYVAQAGKYSNQFLVQEGTANNEAGETVKSTSITDNLLLVENGATIDSYSESIMNYGIFDSKNGKAIYSNLENSTSGSEDEASLTGKNYKHGNNNYQVIIAVNNRDTDSSGYPKYYSCSPSGKLANTIDNYVNHTNPFKVRVVNSDSKSTSTSDLNNDLNTMSKHFGSSIAAHSMYNYDVYTNLTVTDVLLNPYEYTIIINGGHHESSGVLEPYQLSKWFQQKVVDSSLDRYRLGPVAISDYTTGSRVDHHDVGGDNNTNDLDLFDVTYTPPTTILNGKDSYGGIVWTGLRAKDGDTGSSDNNSYIDFWGIRKTNGTVGEINSTINNNGGYFAAPDKENSVTFFKEVSESGTYAKVPAMYASYISKGLTFSNLATTNGDVTGVGNMTIMRKSADNGELVKDNIDAATLTVEYRGITPDDNNKSEIKGTTQYGFDEEKGTGLSLWLNQGIIKSKQLYGALSVTGTKYGEGSAGQSNTDDVKPFTSVKRSDGTISDRLSPVLHKGWAFSWLNAPTTHQIDAQCHIEIEYNPILTLNTQFSTDAVDKEYTSVPVIKAGQALTCEIADSEGSNTQTIKFKASCLVPNNGTSEYPKKVISNVNDGSTTVYDSADDFYSAMNAIVDQIADEAKVGMISSFGGVDVMQRASNNVGVDRTPTGVPGASSMQTSYGDKATGSATIKSDLTVNKPSSVAKTKTSPIYPRTVDPNSGLGSSPAVYSNGYEGLAQNAVDSIMNSGIDGWYYEFTDDYCVATYETEITFSNVDIEAIISKYESDANTDVDKLLTSNSSIVDNWKGAFGYDNIYMIGDTKKNTVAHSFMPIVDISGCSLLQTAISNSGQTSAPTIICGQQTAVHVRGNIYDNT